MRKIIVLIMVVIAALSFAACEKEPIIGYQAEIPQEWIDEEEAEKNNPYTELNRTADLDGIWQNEATGKYYQLYNGHIFALDRIDAQEDEYDWWGTVVAVQKVKKEVAAEYNAEAENELKNEENFSLFFSANYTETAGGNTTMIGSGRTKTVLDDGKEYTFKFIKAVDDWPKGFYND